MGAVPTAANRRTRVSEKQKTMRPTPRKFTKGLPLAILLACASAGAAAEESSQLERSGIEPDSSVLRICAAANEAPYSMSNGTGFENRIAEAVAKAMGRKADFVWSDRPAIYLVRDQLDPKKCDDCSSSPARAVTAMSAKASSGPVSTTITGPIRRT